MRKLIDSDYLTMLLRLVVGITFIYAAIYKIIEPASFAKSIWFYHLLPGSLINLTALILPWVELLCGVFLILGISYRGSVVLVNLMTIVFIVALASTIARGLSIDCGCFKAAVASSDAAWEALYFDLGLLIVALQLLFSRSTRWMLTRG